MKPLTSLFAALGIPFRKAEIERVAKAAGVSPTLVKYWNDNLVAPSEAELSKICSEFQVKPLLIKLRMGLIDERVRRLFMEKADTFSEHLETESPPSPNSEPVREALTTKFGTLYQGDCLNLMRGMPSGSFNLIFADPPFNLRKKYPSNINDALKDEDYLAWCFTWLDECVRLLADGGSLFIYNLPKWNTAITEYLNGRLTFRDWIAIDIKFSLPISSRLYPSHYSLLYYVKGERPATFLPDRLPMEICPNCLKDLKDYGGYKAKMNPKGVSLTDVWVDIPPVRHHKYKKRKGANELSIKLLDRIIEMASKEGDHVFDPFGGSGSTYAVAEIKKRRWTGIEIGPVSEIIERLKNPKVDEDHLLRIRAKSNFLFTPKDKERREKLGLWTHETIRNGGLKSEKNGSESSLKNLSQNDLPFN